MSGGSLICVTKTAEVNLLSLLDTFSSLILPGAFIVTYTIAMIVCGIPMFFQEVAIGQYLGSGGMTFVGQLCPILKGVGFAAMTLVFLLDVYYCIIIAWTIFYLMSTFSYLPTLPWSGCGKSLHSCQSYLSSTTFR
jgi:SNF family Na+-dependent transporter